MYIAIQDTNAGYIQFLGRTANKEIALKSLAADVGTSREELNENELDITELNEEQYNQLVDFVAEPEGGQNQEAIDYLEYVKNI